MKRTLVSISNAYSMLLLLLLVLLMLSFGLVCNGATLASVSAGATSDTNSQSDANINGKQLQLFDGAQSKETNTPNFVRLVVMRLIYGLASTMGLEERLEGAFNGIFVPPNADDGDIFGGGEGDAIDLFGGGGGGGGGDDLLEGLFDADY